MYEDPNVEDDGQTVEFKWAGDESYCAEIRGQLTEQLQIVAEALGIEVEIHTELLLEQPDPEPLYSVRVKGDTAEADTYGAAAAALHTLAKENGQ